MKYKYNIGDVVLVYRCKEYPNGLIGTIKQRDALKYNYCIQTSPLSDCWVKQEDMLRISFIRPKNFREKIKRALYD